MLKILKMILVLLLDEVFCFLDGQFVLFEHCFIGNSGFAHSF